MIPKRVKPKRGQESVWDYPRPPRLESVDKRIKIVHKGIVIADSLRAYRVLETSHPPVYYIPPADIRMDLMIHERGASLCEWKGQAKYFSLKINESVVENVAWCYPNATREFKEIEGYLAFYAFKLDACYVNDEKATPQPGEFYGGWVTKDIVGPFKGERSTMFW